MSDSTGADGAESADGVDGSDGPPVAVPDDEYLDRVADGLRHSYDLETDRTVAVGGDGERFDLYGRLEMTSRKHFVHPTLTYGHHATTEHLFATRRDGVTVDALERYVDLGHDLADAWVDADEEHFSTDFTFALVVPSIPDAVRSFVDGFADRTLIRYGYHGHYEVNLVVVAPEREAVVASESADVARAFALWADDEEPSSGLLSRLLP